VRWPESDEQFAWLDAAPFGERISGDDVAQFIRRAKNHIGARAEAARDGGLNLAGKFCELARFRFENDVAALDESLVAGEFQEFVERTERVHFDFVVASDIDAAKHRDDDGHGAKKYNARTGRKPVSASVLRRSPRVAVCSKT